MNDPQDTNTNSAGQSLRVWGLTKDYGPHRVLDDVSLDVAPGEFLTLLGPSGSGKTTVLMSVAGFVSPTHGKIISAGTDITDLPAEKRGFGLVFQGYALFPHLSVAANIGFALKVRGMGKAERTKRVREVLELVRLEEYANRKPRQLSGGQQQRVALARALAFKPPILLLDEPMGALDRQLKAELQMELRSLHKTVGTTFINVTHDQEEAMTLSDRVAIMSDGKLIEIGKPQELYARPKTKFVAGFLGKSNFLHGKVQAIDADSATIDIGGAAIFHRGAQAKNLSVGNDAVLALRPERITIGNAQTSGETGLSGTISDIIPGGATVELQVTIGNGQTIAALLPSYKLDPGLCPGMKINIAWPVDATVAVEA